MVGEVVRGMGKAIDQINLLEVVKYLKDSRIAVKVGLLAPRSSRRTEADRPFAYRSAAMRRSSSWTMRPPNVSTKMQPWESSS